MRTSPSRSEQSFWPQISDLQAKNIASLAKQSAGVRTGWEQPEFIRSRLAQRLQELELKTFDQYIDRLRQDRDGTERRALVELLTTHTTSFFRGRAHFDWIAEHALPDLLSRDIGQSIPLVFWSAAVSNGAEMWTGGMVLEEFSTTFGKKINYKLLGTDVSRRILQRAATGRFNTSEIQGIPEHLRRKYLLKSSASYSGKPVYKIVPELMQKAKLAYANLVNLKSLTRVNADIVMLRNVLIYFDPDTQIQVAHAVSKLMRPGGYLFIAHTESLRDRVSGLTPIGKSIYQKQGV